MINKNGHLVILSIHHNYIAVHYQQTHGYHNMATVFDFGPPIETGQSQ
jgi:hypothetical protein